MGDLFAELTEVQARFEYRRESLYDRLSRVETNIMLDFSMPNSVKKILLDAISQRREALLEKLFRSILIEINEINAKNNERI